MAEYLIQDTTLDDIADAINAKTGGSSAMTPAEMVTAIGSISGGGGFELNTLTSMNFGSGTQGVISPDIEFSAPSLSAIIIPTNRSIKRIHISGVLNEVNANLQGISNIYDKDVLETIDFDGANISFGSSGFNYRYALKTLNAKVRIISAPPLFTYCPRLQNIQFQENKTKVSFGVSGCPFSNDSLVSCANGLDESVSMTLTLSAAQKTTVNGILGTVTNNGTYSLFEASEQGTVTLMDFITNTKGWTVA